MREELLAVVCEAAVVQQSDVAWSNGQGWKSILH